MLSLLRSPAFNLVASALVAAVATGLAYRGLGFLGVAGVGMLILFMAVQSDLHRDGTRRPGDAERASRTERQRRTAEREGMAGFWRRARLVGAALRVPTEISAPLSGPFHKDGAAQKGALIFAGALPAVGLAGFVLLQLPHG